MAAGEGEAGAMRAEVAEEVADPSRKPTLEDLETVVGLKKAEIKTLKDAGFHTAESLIFVSTEDARHHQRHFGGQSDEAAGNYHRW